VMIVC